MCKVKVNILIRVSVLIFIIGVCLFLAGIPVKNIYAQDTKNSVFITPMSQKIILNPGETYTGTIEVANGATAVEDLKYTVKIGSYTQKIDSGKNSDDYGGFNVEEITNYNLLMNWMTLDKTSGTLAPNGREVITFTIKVPKDAPAGAQYASILFSEDTKAAYDSVANKKGTNVGIINKFQLASVIFANVAGETIEKGSVTENNLPTFLTSNKLEATSMVRNGGNIYTDAKYTLQVWPLFSDEELCTNEESAESSLILPNTERYHVQTCEVPSVGIYRAKQVVKIFGEESVLEKTIIVCPVWLMILIFVIIVAIILGIIIYVKKKKSAKND